MMKIASSLLCFAVVVACGGAEKKDPVVAEVTPTTATSSPSSSSSTAQPGESGGSGACTGARKTERVYLPDVMQAETRAELESSMSTRTVIVAYDCKTLRVLSKCNPSGADTVSGSAGYSIKMQSLRENTIQLKTVEDVRSSFPLSGSELERHVKNGQISLAMAVIARAKADTKTLAVKDLIGNCTGATHFVESANLGAFSLTASSKVGSSAKSISSNDGSLEACRSASPSATTPPAQCRAVVQVELAPLN